MDALRLLIARYRLSDSTVGKEVRELSGPGFHTQVLSRVWAGSSALVDILKVEVMIKEPAPEDLGQYLPAPTDMEPVYENLEQRSKTTAYLRGIAETVDR